MPIKLEFDDSALTPSRSTNFQRLGTTFSQGGQQQAHGSESKNILGAPLQQGLHLATVPAASLTAGLQHYQSGVSLYSPEIARQRAQAFIFQRQQNVQPVVVAQTILERIQAASLLHNSHQQQAVQTLPSNQFSGSQMVPIRPQEPERYVTRKNNEAYSYVRDQLSTSHTYTGPLEQSTTNQPQVGGPYDSSPSNDPLPTIIISPPVGSAVTGEDGAEDSPNDADDSSSADEEEFEEVPGLLVCLYDKVSKSRNRAMHKWKCQFRGGVLVMGEKEYVFARANAELAW